MSIKDFRRLVASSMNSGALELLPALGPPRDAQGLCDHCNAPCVSECICGEAFCSRECLKKAWPQHRSLCEQVVDNTECGQQLTYMEMLSPRSPRQCDAAQCLGHTPWRGGLLRGVQAPTTSRPASVPVPSSAGAAAGPASLVGQSVVLTGLVAKPELNGKAGSVVGWRADKERLAVAVDGVGSMLLKPANVARASGTRCAECREMRVAAAFDASELGKGKHARCRECLSAMTSHRKAELQALESMLSSGDEATRALAEMRLGDPAPYASMKMKGATDASRDAEMSRRLGNKHLYGARHDALNAEVQQHWQIATAYELSDDDSFVAQLRASGGSPPTAEEAIYGGARALMLKEQLCSFIKRGSGIMPRLCAASERVLKDVSKAAGMRADACCVLSHISLQKRDIARALKYMDLADGLQPNDPYILDHRATVHANRDSKASALQDLLRARDIMRANPQPHAQRFLLGCTGNIGKSLHVLGRMREALPELEKYIELAFSPPLDEELTDNERGHAVVAQYMLAGVYAEQGEKANATAQYEQAQERENRMDPDEHRRIEWGQKMMAQMAIAKQAAKDEATLRRQAAERERKRKAAEASQQPLDAALDPQQLYAASVCLGDSGQLLEAAWGFLVALFLSWRYHNFEMLQPVAAVFRTLQAGATRDGAAQLPAWTEPLATIVASLEERTIMVTNQRFKALFLRAEETADELLLQRTKSSAPATDVVAEGGVLAGVDRLAFARACACLFWTRDLMQIFDAGRAPDRSFAYQAQQATAAVEKHLSPCRYLTVLFELAYTNRAVLAVDEAARWSTAFETALAKILSPNAHWAYFKARNTEGHATAQEMYSTMQGAQHRVLARKVLETSERALVSARSSERASSADVMRAEAGIMKALSLLRALPAEDQDPDLIARAVEALAASTGARPATAARAAEEIQGVLSSTRGLEESSAAGTSARLSLESARSHVPQDCRCCKSCGERKSKAEYSENQWRKGQRRCKTCQNAGITTSVAQRAEDQAAEEEAGALRKLFQQQVEAAAKAVEEELEKRNENERKDGECVVCFDEYPQEGQLVLHGTMHWLCAGCLEDMLAPSRRPLRCHMCREELDEDKLRALLR